MSVKLALSVAMTLLTPPPPLSTAPPVQPLTVNSVLSGAADEVGLLDAQGNQPATAGAVEGGVTQNEVARGTDRDDRVGASSAVERCRCRTSRQRRRRWPRRRRSSWRPRPSPANWTLPKPTMFRSSSGVGVEDEVGVGSARRGDRCRRHRHSSCRRGNHVASRKIEGDEVGSRRPPRW